MKKAILSLGCLMMLLLTGAAAANPSLAPVARPLGPAPSFELVQTCQRGYYYCPGRVSGCCPNGWGCGSTRCLAPKRKTEPTRYGNCYWDGTRPICAGSCQPGFVVRKREGSGCITGSRVYCCEPMGSTTQP